MTINLDYKIFIEAAEKTKFSANEEIYDLDLTITLPFENLDGLDLSGVAHTVTCNTCKTTCPSCNLSCGVVRRCH